MCVRQTACKPRHSARVVLVACIKLGILRLRLALVHAVEHVRVLVLDVAAQRRHRVALAELALARGAGARVHGKHVLLLATRRVEREEGAVTVRAKVVVVQLLLVLPHVIVVVELFLARVARLVVLVGVLVVLHRLERVGVELALAARKHGVAVELQLAGEVDVAQLAEGGQVAVRHVRPLHAQVHLARRPRVCGGIHQLRRRELRRCPIGRGQALVKVEPKKKAGKRSQART
mmetsp:Transcript_32746/g.82170  ORF Transcript_32746/g.82170 Transcript_32746/m.82170 type:complete len:233 (-) Transcript_32746:1336-2034(-)